MGMFVSNAQFNFLATIYICDGVPFSNNRPPTTSETACRRKIELRFTTWSKASDVS